MTTSYTPTATKKTTITKFETTDLLDAATVDNLPHQDLADWLKYVENLAETLDRNEIDPNVLNPYAEWYPFDYISATSTGELYVAAESNNLLTTWENVDLTLINSSGTTQLKNIIAESPLHIRRDWTTTSFLTYTDIDYGAKYYNIIDDGGSQLSSLSLSNVLLGDTDNGVLYWNLVKDSSSGTAAYTVSLYNASTKLPAEKVAQGYIQSTTGTVTLSAVGTSSLTGSVVIDYAANDTDAANKFLVQNFWTLDTVIDVKQQVATGLITLESTRLYYEKNSGKCYDYFKRYWNEDHNITSETYPIKLQRYIGCNYAYESSSTNTHIDSMKTALTVYTVAAVTQVQDLDFVAGQTSGAIGKVIFRDTINNYLYVKHKGDDVFSVGENIKQMAKSTAAGTTSITAVYEQQGSIFVDMLENAGLIESASTSMDMGFGVYQNFNNWVNSSASSMHIEIFPAKYNTIRKTDTYAGMKFAFLCNGQVKIQNSNASAVLYNASFEDAGAGDYDIILGTDRTKCSYAVNIVTQNINHASSFSFAQEKVKVLDIRNTGSTFTGRQLLYYGLPYVGSSSAGLTSMLF